MKYVNAEKDIKRLEKDINKTLADKSLGKDRKTLIFASLVYEWQHCRNALEKEKFSLKNKEYDKLNKKLINLCDIISDHIFSSTK